MREQPARHVHLSARAGVVLAAAMVAVIVAVCVAISGGQRGDPPTGAYVMPYTPTAEGLGQYEYVVREQMLGRGASVLPGRWYEPGFYEWAAELVCTEPLPMDLGLLRMKLRSDPDVVTDGEADVLRDAAADSFVCSGGR